MGFYPFNRRGLLLGSDVPGVPAKFAHIAHLQVSAADAVAASNTGVHAAVTLGAASQDVTTAITNPAVPRVIRIKGNAAGIAGNVVVYGTNYAGESINETIALSESNAVDGTKAFKTVTKITLPAKTNGSGDTVSIGWGDALGLPYYLSHNTIRDAFLNNVKESNAPTVTTSATVLCLNTVKLNSALNGSIVDIYLIV